MKSPFPLTAGLFLLLSAAMVRAQTAAELETILDTQEISYAQAAYFALASAGSPSPSQAGAFALARERGWLPENAEAEGKARLDGLSLLLMRSFDIPGGLMYRLLHKPRYAYREIKALGFIRGRAYATDRVSGADFLHILGELLSYTGDAGAVEVTLPDEGRTGNE